MPAWPLTLAHPPWSGPGAALEHMPPRTRSVPPSRLHAVATTHEVYQSNCSEAYSNAEPTKCCTRPVLQCCTSESNLQIDLEGRVLSRYWFAWYFRTYKSSGNIILRIGRIPHILPATAYPACQRLSSSSSSSKQELHLFARWTATAMEAPPLEPKIMELMNSAVDITIHSTRRARLCARAPGGGGGGGGRTQPTCHDVPCSPSSTTRNYPLTS